LLVAQGPQVKVLLAEGLLEVVLEALQAAAGAAAEAV
jgi:hypothetical protein